MIGAREKLHYAAVSELRRLGIEKAMPDPAKAEAGMLRKIAAQTKTQENLTILRVNEAVAAINPKISSSIDAGINRVQEALVDHGEVVSQLAPRAIYDGTEGYYIAVKEGYAYAFDVTPSFIVEDTLAVERITKGNPLFIGTHYRDDVTAQAQRTITRTIEKGGLLSREDLATALQREMGGVVKQRNYWEIVASQAINSSRSYSSMRFFDDAGIYKYEIVAVLDEVTSKQCEYMDGQVLEVQKTLLNYDRYDLAETVDELKDVCPWLTATKEGVFCRGQLLGPDLSGEDLQALGVNAPPFHGNCRTSVAPTW